ncbi:MAG: glucosamine-6-phosphate deaminase [Ignavibacteria bacterium]|nr:glucosamine-6-phosphate deaminase [Ignavibacteria bacterium]
MKIFLVDRLNVIISNDRDELGRMAAKNISNLISNLLEIQDEVRMIFAAAPSQNEFLKEIVSIKKIDWSRITAFHMDEYIGLPKNSPQLFSKYLDENIFSKVNFKQVHLINSQSENIETECLRYEKLLKEKPIDLVCMGIGENGHIAFNDPPVADFNDKKFVKVVKLDDACKQQQVNDGCFNSINEVPPHAVTLTVPALMSGNLLSIMVTGKRKARAVKNTLRGEITTDCPASILRTHPNAFLYLDEDSSSML